MSTQFLQFDKKSQRLTFSWSFPHVHTKYVFDLWDETLGHEIMDSAQIEGALPGTGPSGWSTAWYLPGPNSSGTATYVGVPPSVIYVDHEFSIRVALPDEGGGTGGEEHVSGASILALPDPSEASAAAPAGAAPSAASSPAPAPAAATAPTTAGPLAAGAPGGSWFSQSTAGIPNWALALGGAVIAAEML